LLPIEKGKFDFVINLRLTFAAYCAK
jgi:hypothetical protein